MRANTIGGAVLAGVLLAAPSAHAQSTGFALNRFEPSERGSGWFTAESLDLRGRARPAVGAVFDYQYRPLAIYAADGELRASTVRHVVTAHPGASLVLRDRVRFAVSLPVVLYGEGEAGTVRGVAYAPPADAQSVGDVRVGADVRVVGNVRDPFTLAVGGRAWLPTGSRASYTSDGRVRFGPRLLAAGGAGVFGYAAHVGLTVRDPAQSSFGGAPLGTELVYGGAVGLRLWNARILVGPELFGGTVLSNAFAKRASPLEVLLGGHVRLASGLRFGAGIGTALVSGLGAPGTRGLASFEWSPEEDDAARVAKQDPCAAEASLPENARSPACGGTPIADTDGDGIADKDDACMDVRGAATGDPRTNGCTDSDGDGVLDPLDRCPTERGETTDPKRMGCPPVVVPVLDTDPDHDGVSADVDACPTEPGPPDKNPRRNGCPRASIRENRIAVVEPILFKGDTATVMAAEDGHQILEAVLAVLSVHPEITRVRIEGHTDNRQSVRASKKLTQDRANAVLRWLVSHGIEESRLVAVGVGSEKPIDGNDTEEGREANRRIELHIDKREGAASPP